MIRDHHTTFIKMGGPTMNQRSHSMMLLFAASVLVLSGCNRLRGDQAVSEQELACLALIETRNLTITSAELIAATDSALSIAM